MNTDTLIKVARNRFALQTTKHHLEEKYGAQLTMAHGGGMWRITPEFLAILAMTTDNIVLTDIYNTPILVNAGDFLPIARKHYDTVMGSWLTEYSELMKLR